MNQAATSTKPNVYNDEYGEFDPTNIYFGNRTIYNIFYVRKMSATEPVTAYGQLAESAEDGARTQVTAYEDGGTYVYTLATNLEDMYRSRKTMTRKSPRGRARSCICVRTDFSCTTAPPPATQAAATRRATNSSRSIFRLILRACSRPLARQRFDITYNATYAGAMTTVLPVNTATTQSSACIRHVPPDCDGSTNREGLAGAGSRADHCGRIKAWLTAFDLADVCTRCRHGHGAIDMTSANAVGALLVAVSGQ